MKRVIELIRVSTEQQAASDRASIPAQHAVNARTCAQHGLEVVRLIEVTDVSGASVLAAPEIQELMRLIRSAEIHGVVAREFSRLMRPENLADFILLQAFAESKTILYLPEGSIDFSSKSGRLIGGIRALMAGMERTDILERVWTAKEEKRKRGELAQSSIVLPFGVGYKQGRGFYYKQEAERVRESFRQFLAGNHSYGQLAKIVGVTPRGMSLILRNPIWIGWRVIEEKRDTSAAGRYPTANGRQADRRKVKRSPEEVIRVKVIDKPLVSEADFEAVQRIMDQKKTKHWRCQKNVKHRFTYNGFLTCSKCGQVIYTALARRDYYACKGKRTDHKCTAKYMSRDKLEAVLDSLFAKNLSSPMFIGHCVEELKKRVTQGDSARRIQRLTAQINSLIRKRERVIDSYVEEAIGAEDRDRRIKGIDADIRLARKTLVSLDPTPSLDKTQLIETFAPLAEWEYWTRDQKRAVLSAVVPDIRVADYKVESLGIDPSVFSNNDTHTGRDSWPPPA